MTFHVSKLWHGEINEKKEALKIFEYFFSLFCSSIKYLCPPQGWSLEISGGDGLSTANFSFSYIMKLNWKFQGGRGQERFKPKNHPQGGMDIFLEPQNVTKQKCFLIKMI